MNFPFRRATKEWLKWLWTPQVYNYLARAFESLQNAKTYQVLQKGAEGEPIADWVRAVEGEADAE